MGNNPSTILDRAREEKMRMTGWNFDGEIIVRPLFKLNNLAPNLH